MRVPPPVPRQRHDVALDVVLFLNDLAFFHFTSLRRLPSACPCGCSMVMMLICTGMRRSIDFVERET